MTDTSTPENVWVTLLDVLVLKGGCPNHPGGKENTVSAHHALGGRLGSLRLIGDGAIRRAKKCRDD